MRMRLITLLLLSLLTAMGLAQIKLPGVKLPGGGGDPLSKQPITTSLKDAKFEYPQYDTFTPPDPVRSLAVLQRTPTGGFVLQQGYYALELQSY